MNEYTVFALDSDNEHFGDALFVGSEHLGGAVDALIEYGWPNKRKSTMSMGTACIVRCTKVRCATATIRRHCRGNPVIR
jgi:hypothetical protein